MSTSAWVFCLWGAFWLAWLAVVGPSTRIAAHGFGIFERVHQVTLAGAVILIAWPGARVVELDPSGVEALTLAGFAMALAGFGSALIGRFARRVRPGPLHGCASGDAPGLLARHPVGFGLILSLTGSALMTGTATALVAWFVALASCLLHMRRQDRWRALEQRYERDSERPAGPGPRGPSDIAGAGFRTERVAPPGAPAA